MKLEWDGYRTADNRRKPRFAILTERVRGEGVYRFLVLKTGEDRHAAQALDVETVFSGKGATAKCREAAQRIADAVDTMP